MGTFKVNMFGTGHQNTIYSNSLAENYFLFNIHILQVEYFDIVLSSFDMFISFYANPINPLGLPLKVSFNNQPQTNIGTTITSNVVDRFLNKKPQVIHITGTTPSAAISLYDCGTASSFSSSVYPNSPCLITNPCPNPEDFRLFSMSHYVKVIPYTSSSGGGKSFIPNIGPSFYFDPNWTNMYSRTNSLFGTYILDNNLYYLPITITIIANDCIYRKKDVAIKVYPSYVSNSTLYGSGDALYNPNCYELGRDDKINVP
jgi:hypothetical protein